VERVIAPTRGHSHDQYILDALAEGLVDRAEITRVFAPQGADSRFHRIARHHTRKPHAVAIAKTIPVSAVFNRLVAGGSQARTQNAHTETFRSDR
jgi:hypothetical protein